MSIEIRAELLKSLSGKIADTEPPARRLATRWVKGGVERDFDIMLRLQVLEGVAGVPVGTWMEKPRPRGQLQHAQSYFEDKGHQIPAGWFSPGNTGMYTTVFRCVAKLINSYKLRWIDPLDVITSNLMGLGANLGSIKRPAYMVGQKLKKRILDGQETPVSIGIGMLCKYFGNKVDVEERKQRDVPYPVDEEGNPIEFGEADPAEDPNLLSYDPDEFGEFLAEVVFRHTHDPVGSKVRDLMRAAWHDSPPMLQWLSIVEGQHRYPTQKEVAEKAGIRPSPFHQRHWKPRWKKFLQALKSKPRLLTMMEEKASDYGIYWDASSLRGVDMDSLLSPRPDRPRPRAAANNQEQIKRVASRYISTLGLS